MPPRIGVLDQNRDTVRIWAGMTGLSILCHLLFFSGVLFLPQLGFDRHYIPTTVEVDLVSLPGAGSQVPADLGRAPLPASPETESVQPKEASVQPEQPKETPVQPVQVKHEKAAEETVSVAPKAPEVKKSLKKKTYDASKAIKSAIAKIEKEAPESRPRSVVQAIGKLKEEVGAQPGLAMRGGASAGGAGRKSLDLLDIYNAEIWHTIQKNWAFSEEMVHGRVDLEATIIVKIMREGEIRDIWFEKRSGNNYFDDSVFKAVKKSDPLPPLPEGFRGRFYEVGLRFNLSELQRSF